MRLANESNVVDGFVEGSHLVFDDSFEHEVWWRAPPNGSAEAHLPRVLLAVDLVHPDLNVNNLQ